MAQNNTINIRQRPLFNGTDWESFKFTAIIDLRDANAYEIATGVSLRPVGLAARQAWDTAHNKGMKLINDSIGPSVRRLLYSQETLHGIWTKLLELYENRTPRNRFRVIQDCYSFKFDSTKSVQDNVAHLNGLVSACANAGEVIAQNQVLSILLTTLPQKYESIADAFDIVPQEQQDINTLTAMLLRKEATLKKNEPPADKSVDLPAAQQALVHRAHNNRPSGSRPNPRQNTQPNRKRFTGSCENCGKRGHRKGDCWDLAPNNNNGGQGSHNNFNRNYNNSRNGNPNHNGNRNNGSWNNNANHGHNNDYNANYNNNNHNNGGNRNDQGPSGLNNQRQNQEQNGSQPSRYSGFTAMCVDDDSIKDNESDAKLGNDSICDNDESNQIDLSVDDDVIYVKALSAMTGNVEDNEWIGDSGASRHMTPNRH